MSNISDHVPVFFNVEWFSPISTNIFDTITYHIPILLWACATQAQIEQYQSRLDFYLSNIVIPYTSLLCKYFSCTVSSHTSDLEMFYHNIIDACVLATEDGIPYRNFSRPQDEHKHLPGWTPKLNLAKELSLFWHFMRDHGSVRLLI